MEFLSIGNPYKAGEAKEFESDTDGNLIVVNPNSILGWTNGTSTPK